MARFNWPLFGFGTILLAWATIGTIAGFRGWPTWWAGASMLCFAFGMVPRGRR